MTKKSWKMKIILAFFSFFLFLFGACTATSASESSSTDGSSSSSQDSSSEEQTPPSEEGEKRPIAELVDFVVEVETGRDIRVLQLSDPQIIDISQLRTGSSSSFTNSTPAMKELYCYRYLRQVVNAYDPDFIIVTGDIVYGMYDDNGSALTQYIEFMESFDIPWSPVFGNHENESAMGVDWQCDQFENAENCLFKQRELTGNGNYSVGLVQGDELKRVFFMLDSNGCTSMSDASKANGHSQTSTGFGADQIEWYTSAAETIKQESPQTKLSFAFHIQLSAFSGAFDKYVTYSSYTKQINYNLDTDAQAIANGDFGYIGRVMKSPWDSDRTVWNGLKALGVDSIFVGHEHCNSFSVEYEGIRLTYGQKSSQYDRYNKITKEGNIYDSDTACLGTPLMGGTKITLSKTDGSLTNDCGLILYDESLDVSSADSQGVVENPNGSVTLDGMSPAGVLYTSQLTFGLSGFSASYLGLKGEYGLGTYIDIEFKGNNLPNVMFFADKINGDMTSYGGKGVLVAGGMTYGSSSTPRGASRLAVYGPNRIPAAFDQSGGLDKDTYGYYSTTYGYVYNDNDSYMTVGTSLKYADYPLLTAKGLTEDVSDRTYRYTVGTYLNAGGYIAIDIRLYDATTNENIYDTQIVTKLTESDVTAGNIVIYGAVKGTSEATTFKYGAPYTGTVDPIKAASSGATRNADGSVTLAGKSYGTAGYTSALSNQTAANGGSDSNNSYMGFTGAYGIGTYIDIEFKGNNLPNVMFFADKINGDMTSYGGKGVVIAGGIKFGSWERGYSNLYIYGPNRIPAAYDANKGLVGYDNATYGYVYADGAAIWLAKLSNTNYPLLTQTGLNADTSGDTYKYTVGTSLNGEGKIVVDIRLYNETTKAALYSVQTPTTLTESDVTAGNIVVYGVVKGSDTPTTFKYSEPYTKQA